MGKVFISYRRKDANFAHRLHEKLCERLSSRDEVFIDLHIARDDFVRALTEEVETCDVFVLVVTSHTFDPTRIRQADDWIRKEVTLALSLRKPVALATWEGTALPAASQLPKSMQAIANKQSVMFHATYFEAALDKLAQHVVQISDGRVRMRSKSTESSNITQQGNDNLVVQGENIRVNLGSKVLDAEIKRKQSERRKRDDDFDYFDSHAEKSQSIIEIIFLGLAGLLAVIGTVLLVGNNSLIGVAAIVAAVVMGLVGIIRARQRR
jgi:hypothetical protein